MQNKILKLVTENQINYNIPNFKSGDTLQIFSKIKEDKKERIQIFEGIVIAYKGSGISKNIIIRKIINNIGIEKIFPLHSPLIQKIKIIRKGKVRRAKLFYLRKLTGKAAKIKEIKIIKNDK